MRIIVTGGRDYNSYTLIHKTLSEYADRDPLVVHGDCPTGADRHADRAARSLGFDRVMYPANWERRRKGAGPRRNARMVTDAAVLAAAGAEVLVLAFPGGSGTADCSKRAETAGIPVRYVTGEA